MDTVHECDRQTDGRTDRRTELRSQRPCNAERRTVMINLHLICMFDMLIYVNDKTCFTLLKMYHKFCISFVYFAPLFV